MTSPRGRRAPSPSGRAAATIRPLRKGQLTLFLPSLFAPFVQAADLAALREEIHNIRLRTYPSFVDTKAGQPVRKPLPDQREESLRSAPPPSSRERSALRSPAVAPGLGLPMSEGTTIPGGGNWSSQGPRRSTASRGKG